MRCCTKSDFAETYCFGHNSCNSGLFLLRLQTIKAIIDSRSFKSPKSEEPRRVQVLDLYCLTRFESEGSSKGIVY